MTDTAESEVLDVLDRFCTAFADHDAKGVISLFALDPEIAMVTSEQPLMRGIDELKGFMEGYAAGDTTYSWDWDRHQASVSGRVAWVLAEGTETAAGPGGAERHPYRMTMVLECVDGRWLLRQVHGSSPH